MRSLHDSRSTIALIAGLSLAGTLAGCSTVATSTGAEDAPAPAPTTGGGTGGGATSYADGTYTETGKYQSPGGAESIDVTITLADDIVTAVTVVGKAESQDAKHYQGEFIGGIEAVVVGKDIDTLNVSKVAGSSLTSGGFNAAVDAIKADAAA